MDFFFFFEIQSTLEKYCLSLVAKGSWYLSSRLTINLIQVHITYVE